MGTHRTLEEHSTSGRSARGRAVSVREEGKKRGGNRLHIWHGYG